MTKNSDVPIQCVIYAEANESMGVDAVMRIGPLPNSRELMEKLASALRAASQEVLQAHFGEQKVTPWEKIEEEKEEELGPIFLDPPDKTQ